MNLEDAKDLDKQKRPVLLLHGIGSASFSYRYGLSFHSLHRTSSLSKCERRVYRETCELLGAEGYRAIAADWPGHGSSDKVNMHTDCAADLCSYTQKLYKSTISLTCGVEVFAMTAMCL